MRSDSLVMAQERLIICRFLSLSVPVRLVLGFLFLTSKIRLGSRSLPFLHFPLSHDAPFSSVRAKAAPMYDHFVVSTNAVPPIVSDAGVETFKAAL